MSRGLAIVGGGILLFVAILAIAGFGMSGQARVGVLVFAVAGIAYLFWRDRQREKKEAEHIAADNEKRFAELSAQADRSQFELAVTGPSNIVLAAGVTVFAGVIGFWGYSAHLVWVMLMGLALLGFCAYLLLRVIPALGKPVITLSRSGFLTPLSPQLSWKLVDGIFLQTVIIRGQVASHVLMLRIGTLAEHISQFAPIYRFSHWLSSKAGKERINIVLKGTSEKPEVVYRLARLLWTKNTGRDYDWNPNMSAEYNVALRKMKETADRLKKEQESGLAPPRGPAEVARAMKEMNANGALIAKEVRRKLRMGRWLQYLAIASAIIYVVIRVYGKWGR